MISFFILTVTIVSFTICIILILQVGSIIFTFPPSITSANKVIKILINETTANRKNLKYFYDMGSGNGSLCYQIGKNNKDLYIIGYEKFYPAYLWAKYFRRLDNLKFYHQDFTKLKQLEPGFFYFFMVQKYLDQIFVKMKDSIPKNSCIITYNASIGSLIPSKIVTYQDIFCKRTIYFYQF